MNNNITVKAKDYVLAYSDKTGSLRTSATDGNAFPHSIQVAHIDVIDAKSKLPAKQSKLVVSMSHKDTGGVNPAGIPVTVQLTVRHGTGINAPTNTELLLAIDSMRQILAATSADASALNLSSDIFVTKSQ
jgi:hypothetical protein